MKFLGKKEHHIQSQPHRLTAEAKKTVSWEKQKMAMSIHIINGHSYIERKMIKEHISTGLWRLILAQQCASGKWLRHAREVIFQLFRKMLPYRKIFWPTKHFPPYQANPRCSFPLSKHVKELPKLSIQSLKNNIDCRTYLRTESPFSPEIYASQNVILPYTDWKL